MSIWNNSTFLDQSFTPDSTEEWGGFPGAVLLGATLGIIAAGLALRGYPALKRNLLRLWARVPDRKPFLVCRPMKGSKVD